MVEQLRRSSCSIQLISPLFALIRSSIPLHYLTSLLSGVPGLPVYDGCWVPPYSKVTTPSIP